MVNWITIQLVIFAWNFRYVPCVMLYFYTVGVIQIHYAENVDAYIL